MNHDTLNAARLQFSEIHEAVEFAERHGGRIARTETHDVYWYGSGVMPSAILLEAPILGIVDFGTFGSFKQEVTA